MTFGDSRRPPRPGSRAGARGSWCRGSGPRARRAPAARPAPAGPACSRPRCAMATRTSPAASGWRRSCRGEARHAAADVLGVERRRRRAACRSGRPRATGLKATNAAPISRQASSTAISALRVHSEYSDCTAAIGCTACARRKRGRRDLAQAQRPHLARSHQLGHRADAVLDRHRLVPAVQVVQVDDLGAQAPQAVFAVAADGRRACRRSPA